MNVPACILVILVRDNYIYSQSFSNIQSIRFQQFLKINFLILTYVYHFGGNRERSLKGNHGIGVNLVEKSSHGLEFCSSFIITHENMRSNPNFRNPFLKPFFPHVFILFLNMVVTFPFTDREAYESSNLYLLSTR